MAFAKKKPAWRPASHEQHRKKTLGMEFLEFLHELVFRLLVLRIWYDAVYRADCDALRFVMESDTLGAKIGIYDENVFPF